MKEEIIHYLWQQQAFDRENLRTHAGKPITVQSVGTLNFNAGPDFARARLLIDNLEWHGSVEIHTKASDWNQHGHQHDTAYERVILHVVWEYDQDVYRSDGTKVPVLELKSRVNPSFLFRVQSLLNNQQPFIPCAHLVSQLPDIVKVAQIERAAAQRLERKANEVLALLDKMQGDWSETIYTWLLRSFGFKTNQEGMEQLAQALPFQSVRKLSHHPDSLAGVLLHQAGLYQYLEDDLPLSLPPDVAAKQMKSSAWKYSRTRPTNFPHVRIDQIACLLHQWRADLTWAMKIHPLEYYIQQFHINAKLNSKSLGVRSVESLVINAVFPILSAYGLFHRDKDYQQHAWKCLAALTAESNHIIRKYAKLQFPHSSALDTQGILELYQNYCANKRCLSCSIGSAVLKKQPLFVS